MCMYEQLCILKFFTHGTLSKFEPQKCFPPNQKKRLERIQSQWSCQGADLNGLPFVNPLMTKPRTIKIASKMLKVRDAFKGVLAASKLSNPGQFRTSQLYRGKIVLKRFWSVLKKENRQLKKQREKTYLQFSIRQFMLVSDNPSVTIIMQSANPYSYINKKF